MGSPRDKLALDQCAHLDLLAAVPRDSLAGLVEPMVAEDGREDLLGVAVDAEVAEIAARRVVQELVEQLPVAASGAVPDTLARKRAVLRATCGQNS